MPEFPLENLGAVSMAQLHDCACFVVKSNGAGVQVSKPNWWPKELPFNIDTVTWREKPSSTFDAYNYISDNNNKAPMETSCLPLLNLCNIVPSPERNTITTKRNFLNYLDLTTASSSCSMSSSSSQNRLYQSKKPKTLGNSPHVPFSSDMGQKLLKQWHTIPPEVHEKKLERLERYLSPLSLPKSNYVSEVNYEVTYNKIEDCNHFYVFPTKTFHDKNRLTPKARYLLKTFCRPCSVVLQRLQNPVKQFKRSKKRRRRSTSRCASAHQKENEIQSTPSRELRVVLDNVRVPDENKPCLPEKCNENNNSECSPVQNALPVLKTRNVNALDVFPSPNKSTCQNVINAAVVLTPINGIFGLSNEKFVKSDVSNGNNGLKRRLSPRLNLTASVALV